MRLTIALTAFGLFAAGLPAMAQTPPPRVNHWDISKIDVSKLPPASEQKDVTFDKDILPLFKESCVRCHGDEKPRGGLRLNSLEGVLAGGKAGKMVVPGEGKKSLLLVAAAQIDPGTTMPPKHRPGPKPANASGGTNAPAGGAEAHKGPPAKPLTMEQVSLLRAWIDQGAK